MLNIGRETKRKLVKIDNTCKLLKMSEVSYTDTYYYIRELSSKCYIHYFTFEEQLYLLYNHKILHNNMIIVKYDFDTDTLFTFTGTEHSAFINNLLVEYRINYPTSQCNTMSNEIHESEIDTYVSKISANKKEKYIKAAIELL